MGRKNNPVDNPYILVPWYRFVYLTCSFLFEQYVPSCPVTPLIDYNWSLLWGWHVSGGASPPNNKAKRIGAEEVDICGLQS